MTMNKYLVLLLLLINISVYAQNKKKFVVPLVADKWEYQPDKVEFIEYKGVRAVSLNESSGDMFFKDYEFDFNPELRKFLSLLF